MKKNDKGFRIASVNLDICINCGLCSKVCPLLSINKFSNTGKVYAVINKDTRVVKKSSSGGVFYQVSKAIIELGGVVSGVEFDKNFNAFHSIKKHLSDIDCFLGSKYVQSENNIYAEVKKILENGDTILYSGTPCQVAAIKNYTKGIKSGTLYTVEILCHGVGSPQLLHDHLLSFKDLPNRINFREKDCNSPVISYMFGDRKKIVEFNLDQYTNGFNRCILLNDVCFECSYAGEHRVGDLTIGDFWRGPSTKDIVGHDKEREYPKGVSLVIVNSKKGKKLWEMIQNNVHYLESTLEVAKKGNRTLSMPSKRNVCYNIFWKAYFLFGFKISANIFCASPIYKLKFLFYNKFFRS